MSAKPRSAVGTVTKCSVRFGQKNSAKIQLSRVFTDFFHKKELQRKSVENSRIQNGPVCISPANIK